MTVPELIEEVLGTICREFYADRQREFMRDRNALLKAIATYGAECHQRGWDFDVRHILFELSAIIRTMRDKQAEIQYLPLYLAGAVKRHVGQRAEELSAKAKCVKRNAFKVVADVRAVEVVREPSATEMLSAVFTGLNTIRKKKRLENKAAKMKQGAML